MGNALALRRLLRALGACVALCGAALGGLLALAWPSNRSRTWRGLCAVGETLWTLAVVLSLLVGVLLAVWARRRFRSGARRGGVRGVDRTAPQDESLPRLREARGEGDCLASTKAQAKTFTE